MRSEKLDELEGELRALCDRGDLAAAAGAAIAGYGPPIYGFLFVLHKSEEAASEVFSLFTEKLWITLPRFLWQCSFRTWAYAVARKASMRYRRETHRSPRRYIRFTKELTAAQCEHRARMEMLAHLENETKSRFAQVRDALAVEDQELLLLRADMHFAWEDIARVMHDGDDLLPEEALETHSSRLRRRYQELKERLIEIARREDVFRNDPPTAT